MKKNDKKRSWGPVAGTAVALLVVMSATMLSHAQGNIMVEADTIVAQAGETLGEGLDRSAEHDRLPVEDGRPAPETMIDEGVIECVTDSSKQEIMIGLTYHGDKIQFYGTTAQTGADSVIAVLRSPVEEVKINQAGKVVFVWMTVKQHKVTNIPFIYKIHASKPLSEIASQAELSRLGIGIESIKERMEIHTTKGEFEEGDRDIVFEGLVRLKKKDNLYKVDDEGRIRIKEDTLFSHYFTFPSAAKEGDYIVENFLFKDGELVGHAQESINIQKIGLQAKIVYWANEWPKTYGLVAIIIALSAGLFVGTIFKGGGH